MIEFIERYGAALTFAVIFLHELGLPIPAEPLIVLLGGLVGRGSIDPVTNLLVATSASVCADLAWFQLGRRFGTRVLSVLCRVSLEPDTCVSNTKGIFSRYGAKSLLVAKFVPGFSTVAPPLAGLLGIGRLRFVLWSVAGALLWLVTLGGVGYLFRSRIEELPALFDRMGGTLSLIIVGLVGMYIGWKYLVRHRTLRTLRIARITPEELHGMLLSGKDLSIVDVRHEISLDMLPFTIPRALFITFEELAQRHHEIPRNKDVILYCS